MIERRIDPRKLTQAERDKAVRATAQSLGGKTLTRNGRPVAVLAPVQAPKGKRRLSSPADRMPAKPLSPAEERIFRTMVGPLGRGRAR